MIARKTNGRSRRKVERKKKNDDFGVKDRGRPCKCGASDVYQDPARSKLLRKR